MEFDLKATTSEIAFLKKGSFISYKSGKSLKGILARAETLKTDASRPQNHTVCDMGHGVHKRHER